MTDHFKVLGLIYDDLGAMYDRAVQAGIQDDKLLRALIHAEDTARDLQIKLCNDRAKRSYAMIERKESRIQTCLTRFFRGVLDNARGLPMPTLRS